MKATSLLEKQHRKVEGILKKLESGKSDPAPLLEELANDLAAHMAIEQDIFYPAVLKVKKDLVTESYEEHSIAEFALKRLLATSHDAPEFEARVTTLKELILHHVEEEEEELFPAVEKALDASMLDELGARMKKEFERALAAGHEALLPKTMAKTSADQSKHAHPLIAANGARVANARHASHAR